MKTVLFRPILITAAVAIPALSSCQVLDGLSGPSALPKAAIPEPAQPTVPPPPTAQQAAAPASDIPPVNDDPDQFLGLDGDGIAAQLGTPDLVRRDGPAEVQQFRGSACILDLFLYPEGTVMSVKHVELRGPSLDNQARRACLADIIRERTVTG